MGTNGERFSTGLRFLDQRLGGGLVAGGTLALTAPPDSQVELLFQELAGERDLLYVSLLSPDEAELGRIIDPRDERGSGLAVSYHDPDDLRADPEALLSEIPEGAYVIVDSVNELEDAPAAEYLAFLNGLKRRVREVDGFAVLSCLEHATPPANRALTLKQADHVWDLQVTTDGSEITTELRILKSRENQILPEPLPLELTDEVRIDTSRTIA